MNNRAGLLPMEAALLFNSAALLIDAFAVNFSMASNFVVAALLPPKQTQTARIFVRLKKAKFEQGGPNFHEKQQ